MPLEFTARDPLFGRRRVRFGSVTTGGPLRAHRWPAGGCHQMNAGVVIVGPPVAATREKPVLPSAVRQRATSGLRAVQ